MCMLIMPGLTIMFAASITSAAPASMPRPTSTIRSPSIRTSPPLMSPMASSIDTTQPPLISVRVISSSQFLHARRQTNTPKPIRQ